MRRGVILLFVIIMLASLGSAQNCPEDQRILKLSGIHNSHAAIYNYQGQGYNTDLCYNDLFGTNYVDPNGNDPHTCDLSADPNVPANIILSIGTGSNFNLHGRIPELPSYGIDVCYGDLRCRSTPLGGSCDTIGGEIELLRLARQTNAHFQLIGNPNPYPVVLCCQSLSAGPLCNNGDIQLCPNQEGVCQGASQICTNNEFPGCNDQTYLNNNPFYENPESTLDACQDNLDNDCDLFVDCADPDCQAYPECLTECGNDECDISSDEHDPDSPNHCPQDCDGDPPVCGDGLCSGGEEDLSCPIDCPTPPPVGDIIGPAEWIDPATQEIKSDAFIGSPVTMSVQTTFSEGTTITFRISEADCQIGSPPCLGDDEVAIKHAQVQPNGFAEFIVTIEESWVLDTGPESNNEREFYFIASQEEANIFSEPSNELIVQEFTDPSEPPPIADIVGPFHRAIYFTNTQIQFRHESQGSEPLLVEWLIEQGSNQETENLEEFTKTFIEPGMVLVTLKVTDSNGKIDEQQIAILVIEQDQGMVAFVNEPFHHEVVHDVISSDPTVVEHVVNFAATDSYVINVGDENCPTISCLAGNTCPQNTQNSPIDCTEQLINLDPPLNPGYGSLGFTWNFDSGSNPVEGTGLVGSAKVYGQSSNSKNDKEITLTLNHLSLGLTETSIRKFTLGQCINNGATFLKINPTTRKIIEEIQTSNNPMACSGADETSGTPDDCCPSGFICSDTGCIIPETPSDPNPTLCQHYQTLTGCQEDLFDVAKKEPNYDRECIEGYTAGGNPVHCECAWLPGPGSTGQCVFRKKILPEIPLPLPCSPTYTCDYIYQEGICDGGFMEINVDVLFNSEIQDLEQCDLNFIPSEELCGEDTGMQRVPCGQFNIELPFFEAANLLASASLITIIYFIVRRKNA